MVTTTPGVSASSATCIISCHCGASRQTVELDLEITGNDNARDGGHGSPDNDVSGPNLDISICHCYACRHVTGQMFASWVGIRAPPQRQPLADASSPWEAEPKAEAERQSGSLPVGGLRSYQVVTDPVVRSAGDRKGEKAEKKQDEAVVADYYFCPTCGCHVFRRLTSSTRLDSPGDDDTLGGSGEERWHGKKDYRWEVATGVIVEDSLLMSGGDNGNPGKPDLLDLRIQWRHQNVNGTKDGGLSIWLSPGNRAAIGEPFYTATSTGLTPGKVDPGPHKASTSTLETNPRQHGDGKEQDNFLQATCHCQSVSFSIVRPSSSPTTSTAPRSNFPDLMYPYISTPESVISNPGDVKWWLRVGVPEAVPTEHDITVQELSPTTRTGTGLLPTQTRYLAGTCACRSCRLTSGFEIQSWTFIPRGNISMLLPLELSTPTLADRERSDPDIDMASRTGKGRQERERRTVPLEFPINSPDLPRREFGLGDSGDGERNQDVCCRWPLKSYESSPGVIREFCPICGATVFWHDKWRPDLIDVSVGLLRFSSDADDGLHLVELTDLQSSPTDRGGPRAVCASRDGARHESWLEWWKERVSFAEDGGLDRVGGCSVWGRQLIGELEGGLNEEMAFND